jgi:hypothetical protein
MPQRDSREDVSASAGLFYRRISWLFLIGLANHGWLFVVLQHPVVLRAVELRSGGDQYPGEDRLVSLEINGDWCEKIVEWSIDRVDP